MNNRTFRKRELYYRQNPKEIFASVANLEQVCELIGHQPDKTTQIQQLIREQAPSIFTEKGAMFFLQLLARMIHSSDDDGYKVSMKQFHVIGRNLAHWAQSSPEAAICFYRRLLSGISEAPPPKNEIEDLAAAAVTLFTAQHNPLFLSKNLRPVAPAASLCSLYLEARKSNTEACLLLNDIRQLMELHRARPVDYAMRDNAQGGFYWQPPRFGVPEFHSWQANYAARVKQECGIDALCAAAEKKMPEILTHIEMLWNSILATARRGIRSDGSDTFFISGPWEKFGIGYRYFIPGPDDITKVLVGSSFPCQGTTLWSLTEYSLDIKQECMERGTFGLLSYLANLIAYQQILCKPPATKSKQQHDAPKLRTDVTYEVVLHKVREFERTLPLGWQRDPARADYFLRKFGYPLPEGKTFVYEHVRSWTPGDRFIAGIMGMPDPLFSIDIEETIEKL